MSDEKIKKVEVKLPENVQGYLYELVKPENQRPFIEKGETNV